MAVASDFLIAANDEHGLNPPTAGKRTPTMPYIGRSFYENEFNRAAKYQFILACLRCGFNVFDVHPELQDVSISTRVTRTNRARPTLVVTFAYNASGTTFNSVNGIEVYYSLYNSFAARSRELSNDVYEKLVQNTGLNGRFVGTLSVGMLTNVNCPATLIEAGFMTNFNEAKLMLNPNYVLNVGEAACQGVCEFLDVTYIPRQLENYRTTRRGDRNNFVRILQYLLSDFGYNIAIDGDFGSRTYNAVVNFQTKNNLTADGIVGPNTWRALLNLNPSQNVLRRGSRNSAVMYLQELLLSFLYPITNIDGVFGPETERAVRAFQTENELAADGVVGANTWRALLSSTGREQ